MFQKLTEGRWDEMTPMRSINIVIDNVVPYNRASMPSLSLEEEQTHLCPMSKL